MAAAILWRMAGSPASSQALDGFTDAAQIHPYAQTAMAWAVEQAIVVGTTATTLAPPVHRHPGPRRGPGDALRREIRKHSIPFWPPGLAPGGQIDTTCIDDRYPARQPGEGKALPRQDGKRKCCALFSMAQLLDSRENSGIIIKNRR